MQLLYIAPEQKSQLPVFYDIFCYIQVCKESKHEQCSKMLVLKVKIVYLQTQYGTACSQ